MMNYSKIPEINNLLMQSAESLRAKNCEIISAKDINYGCNITFSLDGINVLLTLYYTTKNGFRFVFQQGTSEDNQFIIKNILFHDHKTEEKLKVPFEKYIGMDEAGKGDFFGALVLAGFIYDKSIEKDLMKLEVGDSKSLSDQKIHSIAHSLMVKFPERVKVKELTPMKYNALYSELKRKGGNLNHLLAYSYKEIIDDCIHDDKDMGILIDKFAGAEFIQKIILKEKPDRKLQLAENAERDPAVAAASIIARALFLKNINEISGKYKTVIPLGGGESVVRAAKAFYKKFGEKDLYSISKNHFKITDMVVGSLF
jgi:ribonuclease HIII